MTETSTTDFNRDAKIAEMVERGALFVINHSGGKDSQAMMAIMAERVPAEQMIVIHANLGTIEWEGVIPHIENTINGLPLIVCKKSNKTFAEMVERRGMFPSPSTRQCTSDLKRGPIETAIRRYLREHPELSGLVVNCVGIRAQESPNRAKATPWKFSANNSKAGREWYDMLPIHDMQIEEVWETIRKAGQEPHWAYSKGMKRLSCKLCIMAVDSDLTIAAKEDPENFAMYVGLERRTGRTMMMPRKDKSGVVRPMGLEEITGLKADFETYPQFYHPEVDFAARAAAEKAAKIADIDKVAEPMIEDEPQLDLLPMCQ